MVFIFFYPDPIENGAEASGLDPVAVAGCFRVHEFDHAQPSEVSRQLVDRTIFKRGALQGNERIAHAAAILGVGDHAIARACACALQPLEGLNVERAAVDGVAQRIGFEELEHAHVAGARYLGRYEQRELLRWNAQLGGTYRPAGGRPYRAQQRVDVGQDLIGRLGCPGSACDVGCRHRGGIEEPGHSKRRVADVDLLVYVHVVLQLDRFELLLVARPADALRTLELGDRVAQLHAPQIQTLCGLADVERDAGDRIDIFANKRFAVRVDAAGGRKRRVGERTRFVGDRDLLAQIDVAAPGNAYQGFVHRQIEALELPD